MNVVAEPSYTEGGALLLDGNRLRDLTVGRLRDRIEAAGSPSICLATVLVGDDAPSRVYVNMKHQKALEAGIISRGIELPNSATQ
ncbi:MAG: tetrahydrofolate dehydrogenase/cyclohydrolase catalytic domain-containing protein, partial [Actinomycetota bacterium]|nr:tetrahydrofolate dehydrogenase/cyclohydrolase catalytic domain-containing protein [Actinomycetota bacterium]